MTKKLGEGDTRVDTIVGTFDISIQILAKGKRKNIFEKVLVRKKAVYRL